MSPLLMSLLSSFFSYPPHMWRTKGIHSYIWKLFQVSPGGFLEIVFPVLRIGQKEHAVNVQT